MAIGHKSRFGVVAAGLSALFALGVSPAHASTSPPIGNGPCVAVEKIELQSTSTGYHDFMAIDPTVNSASDPYWCRFKVVDYYTPSNYPSNPQWSWSENVGLQSQWFYDGPGHYMQACVDRFNNGTLISEYCGALN